METRREVLHLPALRRDVCDCGRERRASRDVTVLRLLDCNK